MIIAIDFDGTCVTHRYPEIGTDIGAIPILKRLTKRGHKLILWTMRSNKELQEAIDWFEENQIKLFAVGKDPSQETWTSTNKCYANLYIDDHGLGIPLKFDGNRHYVDWVECEKLLIKKKILCENLSI